jgi:Holin of 3TMs, for gene-transfer release
MNPILAKLFGGGVDSIGDVFTKVVGAFKLSPEKAAEFEELKAKNAETLNEMDRQLQQKAMEYEAAAVQAASANIRAEASSGDKYTSRARPSFIYLMLLIFLCNYVVFPLIGKPPIVFPDPLFWLFGSCMLGYTAARTWEKFMGAPGDSSIQLGAFKASNKN